jgi:hypothetical protein
MAYSLKIKLIQTTLLCYNRLAFTRFFINIIIHSLLKFGESNSIEFWLISSN